jgi:pimeloyl-ACP methyl ester carboxylesterase
MKMNQDLKVLDVFLSPTGPFPAYRVREAWTPFVPKLQILGYQWWGLGDLEGNYRYVEAQLLKLVASGATIRLSGWSQGALHALRYTLNHPEHVDRLTLIGAPFGGSSAAHFFQFLPAIGDMTPGSAVCLRLKAELAKRAKFLPETHVFIALRDGLIEPHAAMLRGAKNIAYHVFGPHKPKNMPRKVTAGWVEAHGVNHFNMCWHPAPLPYIQAALTGSTPVTAPVGNLLSTPLTA